MTTVEEEGRTPEEAVEAALEKLGLGREYVLVETLEEGTKGFLGLGSRVARVRLTVTPTGAQLLETRRLLGEILRRLGVQADVAAREIGGVIRLEVNGADAGLLIGKHGQTVDSLDFLVSRIVHRRFGEQVPIRIDVEGYRERRHQMLVQRALRLAEQVKSTGKPITLEPMSPGDRREIHLALQRDPRVRTASEGEGALRRLVIAPVDRAEFRRGSA